MGNSDESNLPATVATRSIASVATTTQPRQLPTIIKPRKRKRMPIIGPRIVKLQPAARLRIAKIVGVVALILTLVTILSISPLASFAHTYSPFDAQGRGILLPTPTPSRPVVAGEQEFVCVALPFARLAQHQITRGTRAQPNPWYVSVILAQWGIEQGWQMPGYTGYNFGNVSGIAGQPFVPGVHVVGSPADFAYAPSAEDGVYDYVTFIQNGLYNTVAATYAQGPEAQALALGRSPWDAAHYTAYGQPGSTLLSVMRVYNLKRFDDPNASC